MRVEYNYENFTVTRADGVTRRMTKPELQTYAIELRGNLYKIRKLVVLSMIADVILFISIVLGMFGVLLQHSSQ